MTDPTAMQEGVIQYRLEHSGVGLDRAERTSAEALSGWRSVLRDTALLGEDPARYGGLGYGNLSHRVGARSLPRGRRRFVITGTQTSGVPELGPDGYACVDSWNAAKFELRSHGLVRPSSEAITHATIYDQGPHVAVVLHVHSPAVWTRASHLKLPVTPAGVDYGTPAMADAVASLFRSGRVWEVGAFAMLGHHDGVVAFGRDVDEAAIRLMALEARARTDG